MLAAGTASTSGSGGAHPAADETVASLVEGAPIEVSNALPASAVSESADRFCPECGQRLPLGTDKEQLLEGITRCRMRAWARSSECQNLVHIILDMSTRPGCAPSLLQILVAHLPQFMMQRPVDAFFAVLDDRTLMRRHMHDTSYDYEMRIAMWTFLGTWPHDVFATYKHLLMDEYVASDRSRCDSAEFYAFFCSCLRSLKILQSVKASMDRTGFEKDIRTIAATSSHDFAEAALQPW